MKNQYGTWTYTHGNTSGKAKRKTLRKMAMHVGLGMLNNGEFKVIAKPVINYLTGEPLLTEEGHQVLSLGIKTTRSKEKHILEGRL